MKGLGWKGYIPDHRDSIYRYRGIAKAVPIPEVKYGYRPRFPDVWDQGNLGSCGPHAAVALMTSTMIQNEMDEWPDDDTVDWPLLSPLALYYFYREITGELGQDNGVYLRVLLKVMADIGVPREGLWPYNLDNWNVKPPTEAYKDASGRQIISYHAVYGLEEMILCIAEGYGFLGGIPVYESFMDVGKDEIVPIPKYNEKWLGGHALYFWGYDLHKQVVYGQNSWGPDWGNLGRFALPFDYARTMLSDCWTVRTIE